MEAIALSQMLYSVKPAVTIIIKHQMMLKVIPSETKTSLLKTLVCLPSLGVIGHKTITGTAGTEYKRAL